MPFRPNPTRLAMRLLLLLPSTSYKTADFLKAAEKLNAEVIVACNQEQTMEAIAQGNLHTLDFLDIEHSTDKIVQMAKARPISAVLSTDDEGALLAAAISSALALKTNPMSALAPTLDKAQLRERLLAAGVPSPAFERYSTDRAPEEFAKEIDYPVVLKPTFLSGSQGVIRANNPDEFKQAFRRIKALFQDPEVIQKRGGVANEILVETYIPGKEFAFEGLLQRGRLIPLAFFDKPDPLEGPFFEETLYITPSRLPRTVQDRIFDLVKNGTYALGLKEGPLHAEMRVGPDGPILLEIAARSIGGHCSRILKFAAGMTLEEIILRHALGFPFESLALQNKGASGVMMIPIPKRGILVAVKGLDEAKKITGITEIDLSAHRGQEIIPLPEGRSYFGFIFAKGSSPQAVEDALRKAHRKLDIVVEPRHKGFGADPS